MPHFVVDALFAAAVALLAWVLWRRSTEGRRVEGQLEAAEAARREHGRLLLAVSHEIRTPLTAVIGFADLLRQDPGTGGEPGLYPARILDNGRQLLAYADGLAQLGRLEAEPPPLTPEPVQLDRLLRQLTAELAPAPGPGGAGAATTSEPPVRLELPPDPRPLVTDRRYLEVALRLLLSAALANRDRAPARARLLLDPGGRPQTLEILDTDLEGGEQRLLAGLDLPGSAPPPTGADEPESGAAEAPSTPGPLSLTVARTLCEHLGFRLRIEAERPGGAALRLEFQPEPSGGR